MMTTTTTTLTGFTGAQDFIPFNDSSSIATSSRAPSAEPREQSHPRRGKTPVDSPSLKRKGGDGRDARPGKRKRGPEISHIPWEEHINRDDCLNVADLLHREALAFTNWISPTPEEHEIRSLVVQQIERVVKRAFPDATLLPFGSFQTKLYLPTADIDLVLQSHELSNRDKKRTLVALANALKRSGITDQVTVIAQARVPIVKFVTEIGQFPVDISINQENGVAAGALLNRFLEELPAIRCLVFVAKAFLSQRSINEVFTGGLGSYSTVLLVISFLQMHPKHRRAEIDPSHNLGVLIPEFFECYGKCFNYTEVGISVREGGTYYNKYERGWADPRQGFLLSVEDPVDPSNDVSKGSFSIPRVRSAFAGAFDRLTQSLFMEAKYSRTERGIWPDGSSSILANILSVTPETIAHRKDVRAIWESGILHRKLGIAKGVTRIYTRSPNPPSPTRKDTDKSGHQEESRYQIQRSRSRRSPEKHVYISDEDDSDDGAPLAASVHETPRSLPNSVSKPKSADNGRRRDYWLAKGTMSAS